MEKMWSMSEKKQSESIYEDFTEIKKIEDLVKY